MTDASPYEPASETNKQPAAPTNVAGGANPRPRVWTVFTAVLLGLFLAMFFQAAVGGVLAAIEISRGTDRAQLQKAILERIANPYTFILFACAGQLAFAIAAFVPALQSPEPLRQRIGWLKPRPSWHVYPIAMLSSLAPLAIGLASATALAKLMPPDQTFAKLFDSMTIDSAIVFVVFIGVVPGLVEEVLYRGYMQTRLVKRWGAVAGIIVTSTLFALVHGTPVAIAAAAPLGFWFGYIAWRSGSILPSILCHFFVNSGLNAWRMIGKFGELSESTQTAVHVVAVAIGIICGVICLWPAFWRGKKGDENPFFSKP